MRCYQRIIDFMNSMELPDDISFYDVDGQRLFPIASAGTVYAITICYLIKKIDDKGNYAVQPIEFFLSHLFDTDSIPTKLVAALTQFRQDIVSRKYRVVSGNGGDLGRERDKPIRVEGAR